MNFKLRWLPSAERALMRILEEYEGDASLIEKAMKRMDARVSVDPYAGSESRGDGRRIYLDLPLIATIRIDLVQRLVLVSDMRLHGEF